METSVTQEWVQERDCLHETGEYVCFEYQGISIGYYCTDHDVITWLCQYFAGYFVPSKKEAVNAVIYSSQNSALYDSLHAFATSSGLIEGEEETEIPLDDRMSIIHQKHMDKRHSDNFYYLMSKPDRQVMSVSPGDAGVRRLIGMRTIRGLMKLLLLEDGWIQLHAGCVVKDGIGICLIGDKFAGKTSTMVNLLARTGCDLLANDKILVRDSGTHLEALGFPNKTGIRAGTVLHNAALLRWVEEAQQSFYPHLSIERFREIAATTPAEQLRNRPEKIVLMPLELTSLFQVAVEPLARMKLILSINFDQTLEQSRLERVENQRIHSYLTPHYRGLKKERQAFLQLLFTYDDTQHQENLDALLTKYVPRLALYELYQNAQTSKHTDELVRTLLY